ncbi:MAG: 4-hydroxy-tetrahydrodipicolinate reductase [Rhodanobacter sp.]
MSHPVRIAINGASGRMGGALLDLLGADDRFQLVHAVVAPHSALSGTPVFGADSSSVRYVADWASAPAMDVVIDFSTPDGLLATLNFCVARGVALVSGTTGVSAVLEEKLTAAGNHIALLRAANFSLAIAVLTRLLRNAAAALPTWDIEIVEAHHSRKQDAPSGTALALGRAAAAARETKLESVATYGRAGKHGARVAGTIGFASVRGGDIVGEHQAMLIGTGERLELTHRATDRSIFARGALQAAFWLSQRDAGVWQIDDVVTTTR